MLISTGGVNELTAKIKRFSGREFANFLGNNKSALKETKKDANSEERQVNNEDKDEG